MFNIFNTKVVVAKADPLKAEADALAIAANDHLWMGGGLSGTIKKHAGEEIEAEAVRQGPADLGQTVTTGAGALPYRRIFHVVVAAQDLKTQADRIAPAIKTLLAAVRRERVGRLAIASLESEENLKAFADVAQVAVRALLANLGDEQDPREITFLATSEDARSAYRQALLDAMRGPAPRKPQGEARHSGNRR